MNYLKPYNSCILCRSKQLVKTKLNIKKIFI